MRAIADGTHRRQPPIIKFKILYHVTRRKSIGKEYHFSRRLMVFSTWFPKGTEKTADRCLRQRAGLGQLSRMHQMHICQWCETKNRKKSSQKEVKMSCGGRREGRSPNDWNPQDVKSFYFTQFFTLPVSYHWQTNNYFPCWPCRCIFVNDVRPKKEIEQSIE